MKTFSHTRPVRNEAGEEIGRAPIPARRVTVAELGGSFGPDSRRRLIVMLTPGDVILFRPERTRQAVSMLAVDCYRYVLTCKANAAHLAKARERKAAKQVVRERRRRAAVEKRLFEKGGKA